MLAWYLVCFKMSNMGTAMMLDEEEARSGRAAGLKMFADSPDALHWKGEIRFKRVSNVRDLQSVHVESVSAAVI